jgi:small conductance mechanosensitive channel
MPAIPIRRSQIWYISAAVTKASQFSGEFRSMSNRSITGYVRALRAIFATSAFILSLAGHAQETNANDSTAASATPEETEQNPEDKIRKELSANFAQIAERRQSIEELRAERSRQDGVREEILNALVTRRLDELISLSQSTAKMFAEKTAEASGFEAERAQVVKTIEALSTTIGDELARIRRTLKLPRPEQTPLEQAALSADLAAAAERDYVLIQALIANDEIAAQLGLDVSAAEEKVKQHLSRSAQNASAYLDVTMSDLRKLRRQLKTLPKNKELTARIAVTEQNMLLAAEILRRRAERMGAFGMDVAAYNAQLIAATGALSTEIFDWGVMKGLTEDFIDSIVAWAEDNGARIIFQALIFVIILVIAWKVAHLAELLVRRALNSDRVSLSQLLQRMIVSTTRSVILVLGLLVGLSQLGISIGPLLAGLGIAGFIIGFALQDSLSNFASGLMILIYRPFDIGDIVDVNGAFGTVRYMSLVNTTIHTFDNQSVIVPNNQIWQNAIKNLTGQETRRVDMTFGISYGDDVEKAERILSDIVSSGDKVLKEPEPLIHLHELGDSSVNFIVRPWVRTEDYWETYWHITREVKLRFDAEGISIPFPQRDVHLYTHTPGEA